MAGVEDRLNWLRRPIVVWWLVWVASTAVSVFSIATSFTQDAQGIADNTVTTIVAYLLALAALLLAMKVFLGFERQPVERPAKRWVIVRDEVPHRPEGPKPEPNRPLRLSPKARTRQHSRMNSGDGTLGGHPFVVAHRGASAERPEHTLAAYELALKEGADGVECDVRLTRDGHLVCVHDRRVDRTSNGTGLVSEMTLAQLRELDFGAWHPSWRADGSQRRHRSAHARRPGFAGSGLEPARQDLHRDQASGPIRRAGGEQGAGPVAPVRHRLAGVGGLCPARW